MEGHYIFIRTETYRPLQNGLVLNSMRGNKEGAGPQQNAMSPVEVGPTIGTQCYALHSCPPCE
jgi:hypothetical protein